jgi:hypothetical protein
MPDPNALLDQIRIASPCKASWETMTGDDRVRFCDLCQKRVYNIAGFTAAEAAELVIRHEGKLCVQVYRRRDGKVLTADCPVGVRQAFRRRLRMAATCVAVAAGGLVGTAAALLRVAPRPAPSGPRVLRGEMGEMSALAAAAINAMPGVALPTDRNAPCDSTDLAPDAPAAGLSTPNKPPG